MRIFKNMIPLRWKEPAAIFLREAGHLPLSLVMRHMQRSYLSHTDCTVGRMEQINEILRNKTYRYLEHRYERLAREMTAPYTPGVLPEMPVIWVFWWQGIENAPDIIRRCVQSIRSNSGQFTVQIVDEKNYREFVNVPPHLLEKLSNKTITLTHFADFYRMALLAEHGGLWLDASLFVSKPIEQEIIAQPLFTIRNPGMDPANISNWEWTVGVIGGWKGNSLFRGASELLSAYWREHDILADYFVFDYLIRLLCSCSAELYAALSAVVPNNKDFYFLQEYAGAPFSDALYEKIQYSKTWIYKISWKENYAMETHDGKETLFARWIKDVESADGGISWKK